jgi:hypothetical protein
MPLYIISPLFHTDCETTETQQQQQQQQQGVRQSVCRLRLWSMPLYIISPLFHTDCRKRDTQEACRLVTAYEHGWQMLCSVYAAVHHLALVPHRLQNNGAKPALPATHHQQGLRWTARPSAGQQTKQPAAASTSGNP